MPAVLRLPLKSLDGLDCLKSLTKLQVNNNEIEKIEANHLSGLTAMKTSNQVLELQAMFENSVKEKEILLLSKQNEIKHIDPKNNTIPVPLGSKSPRLRASWLINSEGI